MTDTSSTQPGDDLIVGRVIQYYFDELDDQAAQPGAWRHAAKTAASARERWNTERRLFDPHPGDFRAWVDARAVGVGYAVQDGRADAKDYFIDAKGEQQAVHRWLATHYPGK